MHVPFILNWREALVDGKPSPTAAVLCNSMQQQSHTLLCTTATGVLNTLARAPCGLWIGCKLLYLKNMTVSNPAANGSHESVLSPPVLRRRHQFRLSTERATQTGVRTGGVFPDDGVLSTTLTAEDSSAAPAAQGVQQERAAPPPCAFLRPGQSFEGRQRVAQLGLRKNEHWGVHVTIQGYDPAAGYVCGTMEASNVPEAAAPVTTFFEGEVVDNVNHSFFTADWAACTQTDLRHWSKLEGFEPLYQEVVKSGGRCSQLGAYPYVFLRWKEKYFVKGSESRLTIQGFYYISINRVTGEIDGLYYDPSSSPDQRLELGAIVAGDAGHAFGHYDLA